MRNFNAVTVVGSGKRALELRGLDEEKSSVDCKVCTILAGWTIIKTDIKVTASITLLLFYISCIRLFDGYMV